MARRQARRRGKSEFGIAAIGGIALLVLALIAFAGLAVFYLSAARKPTLDAQSLCPTSGPEGISVVLVDTSDDLPETSKREVLGMLDDLITGLPEYYRLEIRTLDLASARSKVLFSKCNPGNGEGLSEWTENPRIARLRWIESFRKPVSEAVRNSLSGSAASASPIMAAIQDIAIDQFSSAGNQKIKKKLTVISDMIEYTRDYSQYPRAGDLSYQRFRLSPAYLNYRTDLHGASVDTRYVQRKDVNLDTAKHIEFWREWIVDNKGVFDSARRLQGR